jgi:hypothetical protein
LQLALLTTYDIGILDTAGSWAALIKEDMTLPATITMEAANILFAVHGRIWDIVDAYGPAPYLFEFFHDLITQHRLLTPV